MNPQTNARRGAARIAMTAVAATASILAASCVPNGRHRAVVDRLAKMSARAQRCQQRSQSAAAQAQQAQRRASAALSAARQQLSRTRRLAAAVPRMRRLMRAQVTEQKKLLGVLAKKRRLVGVYEKALRMPPRQRRGRTCKRDADCAVVCQTLRSCCGQCCGVDPVTVKTKARRVRAAAAWRRRNCRQGDARRTKPHRCDTMGACEETDHIKARCIANVCMLVY